MSKIAVNEITDEQGSGRPSFTNGVQTSNINGGQVGGRRNLIINGAMQVAQRGTSSGSTSSNGYTSLDRFFVNASGGTYTLSQEEFATGQTDVPGFPTNYMRLNVSTGDNNLGVHQRVEDVRTLGGKTVTLSFWAKGTNPSGGKFASSWIQNFGSGGSGTIETLFDSNIVLTPNWQKYTITANVPSISGKTIGDGSYTWVEILRQPEEDTGTSAWDADITLVQLEVGDTATEFEHRSYGEELALCQRYYYRTPNGAGANFQRVALGFASSASTIRWSKQLPNTMRAHPTLTTSGNFVFYEGANLTASGFVLDGNQANDNIFIYGSGTISGGTAYRPGHISANNDNDATFIFDAEL